MLYNLLYPLSSDIALFNLFKYLTVRSGGALLTGFIISLVLGPSLIARFKAMQGKSKTVRDDHPAHAVSAKQGTPTMGGVMVLISLVGAVLLWCDLANPYVWLLLTLTLSFGTIGMIDDYCGMAGIWKKGIPGKVRLALQTFISCSVIASVVYVHGGDDATTVYIPFFKSLELDLGLIGFMAFGTLVMVGCANGVNLTDGLDGLVSFPTICVAGALAIIAYIVGRADFTEYLIVPHIPGAGELTVFLSALMGAVMGFLWYNAPPARIFMGDTGALAIGGALGGAAVMLKHELVFAIIAGLFVVETLSVMIQVTSFKLRGKRVFRRAPIHHHFEQLGWPETTIVIRFWIIAFLFALIGLATLKLR